MGLDEFMGVLKRRWLVVLVSAVVVVAVAIPLSGSGDEGQSFSATTKLLLAEGIPRDGALCPVAFPTGR